MADAGSHPLERGCRQLNAEAVATATFREGVAPPPPVIFMTDGLYTGAACSALDLPASHTLCDRPSRDVRALSTCGHRLSNEWVAAMMVRVRPPGQCVWRSLTHMLATAATAYCWGTTKAACEACGSSPIHTARTGSSSRERHAGRPVRPPCGRRVGTCGEPRYVWRLHDASLCRRALGSSRSVRHSLSLSLSLTHTHRPLEERRARPSRRGGRGGGGDSPGRCHHHHRSRCCHRHHWRCGSLHVLRQVEEAAERTTRPKPLNYAAGRAAKARAASAPAAPMVAQSARYASPA